MSQRSRRSQRSGGNTGIITTLLNAYLNRDSELVQNPDFGKQPGEVDYRYKGDPSEKVKTKYTDRGGGILGSKLGQEAEYERLTGIDAANTELSKAKSLLEFSNNLEQQIRQARLNEEGLLYKSAADVYGRKPGIANELGAISAGQGGVDFPTPYNAEYGGQVMSKLPTIAKDQQGIAEARLATQRAGQTQAVESSQEFQDAQKENLIGLLYKALNVDVAPGHQVYEPRGGMLTGMTERQDIIPPPMYTDPKTKMQFPMGEPKVSRTQVPGQRFPAVNLKVVEQILNGNQMPAAQVTDDAPSPMLGGGILGETEGINDDASLLKALDQQTKLKEKQKQRQLIDSLLMQLRR